MEKCGNFLKNGRFSGRIWPDWGNTTRADMAGLGSIGLTVTFRTSCIHKRYGNRACKYLIKCIVMLNSIQTPTFIQALWHQLLFVCGQGIDWIAVFTVPLSFPPNPADHIKQQSPAVRRVTPATIPNSLSIFRFTVVRP